MIIKFKLILPVLFSLVYTTQLHSQQQSLKKFEGYYQFTNDTATYLHITSKGNNLILHQLWDGKEINFERKSEFEFFNGENSFPLNSVVIKMEALPGFLHLTGTCGTK
jgi:hypothetical protein